MSTPRGYLRVLAARRLTIIVVTIIALVIGGAYSALKKRTYQASATIQFVQQTDIGVFAPGVQTPVDVSPTQSAAANSQIVTRTDVVAAVQKATRSGMSTDQLQSAVNAAVQPNSNLIAVQVTAGHAGLASTLANQFAIQTQAAVRGGVRRAYAADAGALRSLLRRASGASTRAAYRQAISRVSILSQVADPVQVVRPATTPSSPASPKPATDVLLALVLGLIAGTALAFARNAFDLRITDVAGVEREMGLPLVGYVHSEILGLATGNGIGMPGQDHLENFRILRTNVAFLAPDRDVESVAVTSAVAEEGKSTVSAWYAYVSAASGVRTLLVDCDLRKPRLAERFDLAPTPGLTDFLAGSAEPQDVLRVIDVEGPDAVPLTVIPAGATVQQPAEAIGSQRFTTFIEEVSHAYDLVIFDTAPLLPVSDTLQLVPQVKLLLLCVRVGQTTRGQTQAVKQTLANLPGRPTGVVVSGIQRSDDHYYYYRYGDEPGSRTKGSRRRVAHD